MPIELVSLAIRQFYVDHPDNPNSMKSVARRGTFIDTTTGEANAINIALIDSLYASQNIPAIINSIRQKSQSIISSQVFTLPNTASNQNTHQGTIETQACDKLGVPINNADDLNKYMFLQDLAKKQSEFTEYLALGSALTGVALAVGSVFNPALGLPAAVVGIVTFASTAFHLNLEWDEALYPSDLLGLEVEASVISFEAKGPVPEFGEITKITLAIADSGTFNITDAIADMIGASSLKILKNSIKDELIKVLTENLIKKYKGGTFGPFCWNPIDVTNEPNYVKVSVEGESIQLIDTLRYAPVPKKSGVSTLVATTLPDKFAGKSAEPGRVDINVNGYFIITNTLANVSLNYNTSTTLNVRWEGTAKFPVEQSLLVSLCDSNFNCYPGNKTVTAEVNPLKQGLGCFCSSGNCRSGGGEFYIQLEDSQGLIATSNEFRLNCIDTSSVVGGNENSQSEFSLGSASYYPKK